MAQTEIKHREVYKHIHEGILSGAYAIGQRIPTEAELASTFDTSRVTVARALRDLEMQGLLVRRRGAGSFVRSPDKATGALFGLVTGNTPGLLAKISDAMAREAHAKGLGLLSSKWSDAAGDLAVSLVESLCAEYTERRVAGVFLAPPELPEEQAACAPRLAQLFASRGIPVVLLDRDVLDPPQRSNFDVVGIDNFQAGYVLTEHLWNLGRRRIAFVSHPRVVSTTKSRSQGYRFAIARFGQKVGPEWVQRGETGQADFVRRMLSSLRPDGVVCVNDHEAAQLIRTLTLLGVRVPDDVAIVSVDDDQWATYLSISLTTLRQPFTELGTTAFKVMLERLADPGMPPREICLACNLVVRESCGAKRKLELAGS